MTHQALEALADLEHVQWIQWTEVALELTSHEERMALMRRADKHYEELSNAEKSPYRSWALISMKTAALLGVDTSNAHQNLELLAAWEHKQWGHWIQHMQTNLTPVNVARWERQAQTDYADLSEDEKDADRVWARVLLGLYTDSAPGS